MSLKTARRASPLKAALKAAAPKLAAPKRAAPKAAPKNVAPAVALRSRAATMQGLNPRVVAALSGRGARVLVPQSSFAPPPPPSRNPKKATHADGQAHGLDKEPRLEVPRGQLDSAVALLAKAARAAAEAIKAAAEASRRSGGKTSKPTDGGTHAETPDLTRA